MASLHPGQAELIARWLKLYGYAWQQERPATGKATSECFTYSAERIRLLGETDERTEKFHLPLSLRDAQNLRELLYQLSPELMIELSDSAEQYSAYVCAQSHTSERINALVPEQTD